MEKFSNDDNDPIVIVGLAVNLPKVGMSVDQFWEALQDSKDLVQDGSFPKNRKSDIEHVLPAYTNVIQDPQSMFFTGNYFQNVDQFDNTIFGISDSESVTIEPQQRMFMETVWQLLSDCSMQNTFYGSRTGVYVGHSFNQYQHIVTDRTVPSLSHGNHTPFIAGRVSYLFNLSGPSMMVCTGCSSSLLAVHLAANAILTDDCDQAIAGGITLDLLPVSTTTDIWNLLGITGPGVRCRSFAMGANGICKAEGSGVVMLMRRSKAVSNGHHIYGLLKSTLANHDGHSNGISAPSPLAQANLLEACWKKAKINPRDIQYIETHGTGTELGDPIEEKGIRIAFGKFTEDKQFCSIGSCKSNLGHLADGAAGVVGLIKVLLSMHWHRIPPTIHVQTPNTFISWESSPVFLQLKTTAWELNASSKMLAGVSSFGLLGTNVHVVVQNHDYPASPANTLLDHSTDPLKIHGILLASRSQQELCREIDELQEWCKSNVDFPFAIDRLSLTLNIGRSTKNHSIRMVVICSTIADFQTALQVARSEVSRLIDDSLPSNPYVINSLSFKLAVGKLELDSSTQDESCEPISGYEISFLDELISVAFVHRVISWKKVYSKDLIRTLGLLPMLPCTSYERRRFWPTATTSMDIAPFLARSSSTRIVPVQNAKEFLKTLIEQLCRRSIDWSKDSNTSFIELGMDSLEITRIRSHVQEELGILISLDVIHENITLDSLATVLQSMAATHQVCEARVPIHKSPCLPGSVAPISSSQQRIWLMHELDPTKRAYNVGSGLFINGKEFSSDSFCEAVEETVKSHIALNCSFHMDPSSGEVQATIPQYNNFTVEFLEAESAAASTNKLIQDPTIELKALLHSHDSNIFLQFSGQGTSFMSELREMAQGHHGMTVVSFVTAAVRAIVMQASIARLKQLRGKALHFNLENVIFSSTTVDSEDFIAENWPSLSCPLILTTQIARYLATLGEFNFSHQVMISETQGLLGHSQGIVAALVVAGGKDENSIMKIALDFVNLLFWIGLRCEQSLVWSSELDDLPEPCMLSVSEISKAQIEASIDGLNTEGIRLIQTSENFVVVGSQTALSAASSALLKVKAQVKLLNVRWPFHSNLLHDAMNLVITEDIPSLNIELQFPQQLSNTVYSTFDGRDMRECIPKTESIAEFVTKLICEFQLDWTLCTREIGPSSFVFDFGPDGSDSPSLKLTTRNRGHLGAVVLPAQNMNDIKHKIPLQFSAIQPGDAQIKRCSTFLNAQFNQPFDLEKGPILKAYLVRWSMDSYFFCLIVHHIVVDGWSYFVLFNEIWRRYKQSIGIETPQSDQLGEDVTFADFARWEKLQLDAVRKNETAKLDALVSGSLPYWCKELQKLPLSCIPGDLPRPKAFSFRGTKACRVLRGDTTNFLLEYLTKNHFTLHQGLLSLVFSIVAQSSGQSDIVIGTPLASRPFRNLDRTVSCLTNVLPIRISKFHGLSFYSLIMNVRQKMAEAQQHQFLPLDVVFDATQGERDPAYATPFFNIVVVFHNSEQKSDREQIPSGLRVTRVTPIDDTCKWDLYFDFMFDENANTGSGLTLRVEYYKDLYSARFIHQLLKNMEDLLNLMMHHPDTCIEELTNPSVMTNVLPLCHDWIHVEDNIFKLALRAANQFPDFVALCNSTIKITYADLKKEVDKLVPMISEASQIGNVAILSVSSNIQNVAASLAVGLAKRTLVLLDPTLHRKALALRIGKYSCGLLCFDKTFGVDANHLLWECPSLETILCFDGPAAVCATDENLESSAELWNLQHKKATTSGAVDVGGWISSYDGSKISEKVMKEFTNNVVVKLKPYLSLSSRICEIGCSTGFTMAGLVNLVGHYTACDIASSMIDYVKEMALKYGWNNVDFCCTSGLRVATDLQDRRGTYDVIVLNSVVHYFTSHDYLLEVIRASKTLLKPGGVMFLGDVPDLDRREALMTSLINYAKKTKSTKTKLSFDNELFVSYDFLNFAAQDTGLKLIGSWNKESTEELNELTFRFDAILQKRPTDYDESNITERNLHVRTKFFHEKLTKAKHRLTVSDDCTPALLTYGGLHVSLSNLTKISIWLAKESNILASSTATILPTAGKEDMNLITLLACLASSVTSFVYDSKLSLDYNGQDSTSSTLYISGHRLLDMINAVNIRRYMNVIVFDAASRIPDIVQALELETHWNHNPNLLVLWADQSSFPIQLFWKNPTRTSVFDSIYFQHRVLPPANIVPINGLQVLNSRGNHCELQRVGQLWFNNHRSTSLARLLFDNRVQLFEKRFSMFEIQGHSHTTLALPALQTMLEDRCVAITNSSIIAMLSPDSENPILIAGVLPNSPAPLAKKISQRHPENSDSKWALMPSIVPNERIPTSVNGLVSSNTRSFDDINAGVPPNSLLRGIPLDDLIDTKIKITVPHNLNFEQVREVLESIRSNYPTLKGRAKTIHGSICVDLGQLEDKTPYDPVILKEERHVPLSHGTMAIVGAESPEFVIIILHPASIDLESVIHLRKQMEYQFSQQHEHEIKYNSEVSALKFITARKYLFKKGQEELKVSRDSSYIKFWREYLRDIPQSLEIWECIRQLTHTNKLAPTSVPVLLSADTNKLIDTIATTNKCSPDRILMTAFAIAIARVTNIVDFTLGLPVSLRPTTSTLSADDADLMITNLTNLIPVRCVIDQQVSFHQTIATMEQSVRKALSFARLPCLEIARTTNSSSLFQAVFAASNVDEFPENRNRSFADITLYAIKALSTNVWQLTLVASSNFSQHHDIEQFSRIFAEVVTQVVKTPSLHLRKLSFLPPEVMSSLLEFSEPFCSPSAGRCPFVHELIAKQAQLTPDKTAIVCAGRIMTYKELNERSACIANKLLRMANLAFQDRIGVLLPRSIELVVALIGILRAGCTYVPLDPEYPTERIEYYLRNSEAKVLITEEYLQLLKISGSTITVLSPRSEEISNLSFEIEQTLDEVDDQDREFCIIYTSGSTSQPKGVVLSHSGVQNTLSHCIDAFSLHNRSVCLATTTPCFDISILELFAPLQVGSHIIMATREEEIDPVKLGQLVNNLKVNFMQGTPTRFQILLNSGWQCSHPHELLILCGGEALLPSLCEVLVIQAEHVWNGYGPSETSIYATFHRVHDPKEVCIGKPFPGTSVFILNEDQYLVEPGTVGEIYIGGIGVSKGYYNRPDLNTDRFVDININGNRRRVYRSGDLARWRSNGELEYLGRNDAQLKVRGYRMESAEIESEIMQCAGVICAAVGSSNNELYACVCPRTVQETVIRATLQRRLPRFMIPSHIFQMDSLPLTPNNKLDRKKLASLVEELMKSDDSMNSLGTEKQLQSAVCSSAGQIMGNSLMPKIVVDLSHDTSRTVHETLIDVGNRFYLERTKPKAKEQGTSIFVDAQSDIFSIIGDTWRSVLPGSSNPELDSNFFDSGGNSIAAVRFVQLLARHDLHATVADIFDNPTPRLMAQAIMYRRAMHDIESKPVSTISTAISASNVAQHYFRSNPKYPNRYVLPAVFEFSNIQFCREKLQKAISEITHHHDALRTKIWYSDIDTEVKMQVVNYKTPTIFEPHHTTEEVIDEQNLWEIPSVQNYLEDLIDQLSLVEGKVVAVGVILTLHKFYVVIVVHHLVVDLAAWVTIFSEFERHMLRTDTAASVSKTTVSSSYADYCEKVNHLEPNLPTSLTSKWETIIHSLKGAQTTGHKCLINSSYSHAKFKHQVFQIEKSSFTSKKIPIELELSALGPALGEVFKQSETTVLIEDSARSWVEANLQVPSGCVGYICYRYPVQLNSSLSESLGKVNELNKYLCAIRENPFSYEAWSRNVSRIHDFVVEPSVGVFHLGDLTSVKEECTSDSANPQCTYHSWPKIMIRELGKGRIHRPLQEYRQQVFEIFCWTLHNSHFYGVLYDERIFTPEIVENFFSKFFADLQIFVTTSGTFQNREPKEALHDYVQLACKFWSEAVQSHKLGHFITDQTTFAEYGGDSLRAKLMTAKLAQYGLQITTENLISMTFAEFCSVIREIITRPKLSRSSVKSFLDSSRNSSVPLSEAQLRMMYLTQMSPDCNNYAETLMFNISAGQQRVKTACEQLLSEEFSLGTAFTIDGASILQSPGFIKTLTTSNWHENDRTYSQQEAQESLAQKLSQSSFDLTDLTKQIPLCQFYVCPFIHFGEVRTMLAVVIHHSIMDAHSLEIVVNRLYRLVCHNNTSECVNDGISRPEFCSKLHAFIQEEGAYLRSDQYNIDRDFWVETLSTPFETVGLPNTKAPDISSQSFQDSMPCFEYRLSLELNQMLHTGNNQGQIFSQLLASYLLTMAVYSGTTDLIVSIPISLRNYSGDFAAQTFLQINTLLFRYDIKDLLTSSFTDFVVTVQKKFQEVEQHGRFPIDKVIELLRKTSDTKSDDRVERKVLLNYDRSIYPVDSNFQIMRCSSQFSKADLSIDLVVSQAETGNRVELIIEYRSDLYHSQVIESFTQMMGIILTRANKNIQNITVAAMLQFPISLRMFTMPPRREVANKEESNLSVTFSQLCRNSQSPSLIRVGEKPAIDSVRIEQLAYQMAKRIFSLSEFNNKCPIILYMHRNWDIIVCILAIWKCNGCFVPVSYGDPGRLQEIVKEAGSKIIITNEPSLINGEQLQLPGLRCLQVKSLLTQYKDIVIELPKPEGGENIAYCIFTSGSTGTPKQCRITHNNLQRMIQAWKADYRLDTGEFQCIVLQWAVFSFDVFMGDIMRALFCTAGHLVFCPEEKRLDLDYIRNLIDSQGITIFETTPGFLFPLLAGCDAGMLSSLRILVAGSDKLLQHQYSILRSKLSLDCRLLNSYGMSEATIDSSFFEWNCSAMIPTPSRMTPIGKAMTGVELAVAYIQGNDAIDLPFGAVGELCIGTRTCGPANGSLVKLFNRSFMRTGDKARWLLDGNIEHLGRLDRTIKIRGRRVDQSDVETHILAVLRAETVAVHVNVVNFKDRELLVAFAVPKDNTDSNNLMSLQQLKAQLVSRLPSYLHPEVLKWIPSLPFSKNGKVNPKGLPSIEESDITGLKEREGLASMSADPIYQQLQDIWRQSGGALGTVDSTWLETGNSIMLLIFQNLLKASGFKDVTVSLLFEYTTIRELGDYLKASSHKMFQDEDSSTLSKFNSQSVSDPSPTTTQVTREGTKRFSIAIVGVGIRLPGNVNSLDELIEALLKPGDFVRQFPANRRDDYVKCVPLVEANRVTKAKEFQGCFLQSVDGFDPQFFRIPPEEACNMSIEQRLLLQVATEALDDASLLRSQNRKVGVFIAAPDSKYSELINTENPTAISGTIISMIPRRIAYFYDFQGPTELIDSACASGLAAMDRAISSIHTSNCEAAIVGGANIFLFPHRQGTFSDIGILSPDFHCRSFDVQSNGTAAGEGAIAVVLKSLSAAERDKDYIYGVIESITANNCGKSSSLVAPKASAQVAAIREALIRAELSPLDVDIIEAHGTGTKIGDQVELDALQQVFRERSESNPVKIGSSKSKFGHLDSAAGLLGLVKILACFKSHIILPTHNFSQPHELLQSDANRLQVSVKPEPWRICHDETEKLSDIKMTMDTRDVTQPTHRKPKPRIAGLTSLGLNGATYHAVLTEHKAQENKHIGQQNCMVLTISGATAKDLILQLHSIASFVSGKSAEFVANVCYTMAKRRFHRQEFRMILSSSHNSHSELMDTLQEVVQSTREVLASDSDESCQTLLMSCCSRLLGRNFVLVENSTQPDPLNDLQYGDRTFNGCCSLPVPSRLFKNIRCWCPERTNGILEDPMVNNVRSILEKKLIQTLEIIRHLNINPPSDLQPTLLHFCNGIILKFLRERGILQFTGIFSDLFRRLQMHERYLALFTVMWDSLREENILVSFDDSETNSFKLDEAELLADRALQDECDRAVLQYPAYSDQFKFPLYVSKFYNDVLCGQMSPLSVIYPNGDLFYVESNYVKLGDCMGDVLYNMYCQFICEQVSRLMVSRSPGSKIRILECGAGMGLVTRQLVARLDEINHGRNMLQYFFTDLGKAFVENAKRIFADYQFMKYQVFDITKPGVQQGLLGKFDVIISYNVIHTTPSIQDSLNNLVNTLDENGNLFVIESCRNETWSTLAWGVLDGWWNGRYDNLRPDNNPMMDPERWKRAMKEAGFRQIVSCPSDLNPVLDVEKHMLVCSKQPETEIELHNRAVQKCWWEGFRPSDSLQALQNDTHRTIEALSKQSVPLATESEEWQIQPAQVESMMQEIWCELLGHKTINVNSSFASLGGESLVTIRMIQVVRRLIGADIEIADVFAYPTVKTLSAHCIKLLRKSKRSATNSFQQEEAISHRVHSNGIAKPSTNTIVAHAPLFDCSNDEVLQQLNMKIVCIFPGQGSATIDEFKNISQFPAAQQVFSTASKVLGYDLLESCQVILQDPSGMKSLDIIQLAVLTSSVASLRSIEAGEQGEILQRAVQNRTVCTGLSLGQYSALVAAHVLDFDTAVVLVQARAKLMEEKGQKGGGMLSIAGIDLDSLQKMLQTGKSSLKIANYLAPNHFVLSGSVVEIEAFELHFSNLHGNVSIRRLPVLRAFHSKAMKDASDVYKNELQKYRTAFKSPQTKLIMNGKGGAVVVEAGEKADVIFTLLEEYDIDEPCYWSQMNDKLQEIFQSDTNIGCIEVGCGKVLSRILQRRKFPNVVVRSTGFGLEQLIQRRRPSEKPIVIASQQQRLRIVVLHGMSANGEIMKTVLTWRRWNQLPYDFVCLTAPHIIPALPHCYSTMDEAGQYSYTSDRYRSWGISPETARTLYKEKIELSVRKIDNEPELSHEPKTAWRILSAIGNDNVCLTLWKESLESIKVQLDEIGPIHGLVGMSEGALVCALLVSAQNSDMNINHGHKFKFSIHICSGDPQSVPECVRQSAGLSTLTTTSSNFKSDGLFAPPSLHIIGGKDKFVKDGGVKLAKLMKNSKIVTLPNLGHEMPFIDSKSTVVTDFLQEFVAT